MRKFWLFDSVKFLEHAQQFIMWDTRAKAKLIRWPIYQCSRIAISTWNCRGKDEDRIGYHQDCMPQRGMMASRWSFCVDLSNKIWKNASLSPQSRRVEHTQHELQWMDPATIDREDFETFPRDQVCEFYAIVRRERVHRKSCPFLVRRFEWSWRHQGESVLHSESHQWN